MKTRDWIFALIGLAMICATIDHCAVLEHDAEAACHDKGGTYFNSIGECSK